MESFLLKKILKFSEEINISDIKDTILSINDFFKTDINKEIFIPNLFRIKAELSNDEDHYYDQIAIDNLSFKEIERKINSLDEYLIYLLPKFLLENTIFISNKIISVFLYKKKYTEWTKIEEIYFSEAKGNKDTFLMLLDKAIKDNIKNESKLLIEVSLDFFGEINNPEYFFEYFFILNIRYSNDFELL